VHFDRARMLWWGLHLLWYLCEYVWCVYACMCMCACVCVYVSPAHWFLTLQTRWQSTVLTTRPWVELKLEVTCFSSIAKVFLTGEKWGEFIHASGSYTYDSKAFGSYEPWAFLQHERVPSRQMVPELHATRCRSFKQNMWSSSLTHLSSDITNRYSIGVRTCDYETPHPLSERTLHGTSVIR